MQIDTGKFFAPWLQILTFSWLVIFCISIYILQKENRNSYGFSCDIHQKQTDLSLSKDFLQDWRILINQPGPPPMKFFQQASAGRNSSYPFISGDTFRAMADHIFDETTDVSGWAVGMKKIKAGDVVFLGTEVQLTDFFRSDRFNKIRHPFVLITHNSDASVPTSALRWVLEHEKILVWFASNPDYVHRKLVPIPIGLANSRWSHGNVSMFRHAALSYRKSFESRTTLLYVNFELKNNIKCRTAALRWARQIPNVSVASFSSLENYLKQLGNAKFVLSPPGNGLDCHRTWEAILMGAIPIVLRSYLDPLFFNSPVLIVDDWNNLNIEYLQSLTHNGRFNPLLLAEYWHERIDYIAKHRLFSYTKLQRFQWFY